MNPSTLILLVGILAGCAAAEPPPAPAAAACPCACPPVAGTPTPAAPASAASAAPTPATTAARDYHATEKHIAPAVTATGATAAYIRAVDQADKLAREALRFLVSQDGHPTAEAITTSRERLEDLVKALDTPR